MVWSRLYQLTNDLAKSVLLLDRTVCGEKVSGFVHAIGPYLTDGAAYLGTSGSGGAGMTR